jgi:ribulose-5-phosphate 4-epimerase/fuculose-1-phosphate aldolase
MPSAFDGYLPNDWEEQEAERKAAVHGLTVQEYNDLQIWIRHGRIGRGTTYQHEVERAKKIEAERNAALSR